MSEEDKLSDKALKPKRNLVSATHLLKKAALEQYAERHRNDENIESHPSVSKLSEYDESRVVGGVVLDEDLKKSHSNVQYEQVDSTQDLSTNVDGHISVLINKSSSSNAEHINSTSFNEKNLNSTSANEKDVQPISVDEKSAKTVTAPISLGESVAVAKMSKLFIQSGASHNKSHIMSAMEQPDAELIKGKDDNSDAPDAIGESESTPAVVERAEDENQDDSDTKSANGEAKLQSSSVDGMTEDLEKPTTEDSSAPNAAPVENVAPSSSVEEEKNVVHTEDVSASEELQSRSEEKSKNLDAIETNQATDEKSVEETKEESPLENTGNSVDGAGEVKKEKETTEVHVTPDETSTAEIPEKNEENAEVKVTPDETPSAEIPKQTDDSNDVKETSDEAAVAEAPEIKEESGNVQVNPNDVPAEEDTAEATNAVEEIPDEKVEDGKDETAVNVADEQSSKPITEDQESAPPVEGSSPKEGQESIKEGDSEKQDAGETEISEKVDEAAEKIDGEAQEQAKENTTSLDEQKPDENAQDSTEKDVETTESKVEDEEKVTDEAENVEGAAEKPEGEAAIQPPIVESPIPEKKAKAEEDGDGPAKDFYYELEQYQSSSVVSEDSGIPTNLLQFYHSFGYDCCKRSNLHLLNGPTLLYAAGNLVHLLNLATGEHTYLRSCSGGGIGALTVHPSGKYFTVAEKGTKPNILVYEFPSLKLYRILKGGTERAYSFVDFNPSGDLLASVGSYPDYLLTVWAWEKEKIQLRSKAFSQEVYRVTFSPEQEGQLTSCGTTHIRFWKMAFTFTGLKLKGELGRFGKTALSDIEGYIQLPDGKVLSGSDWGSMLLWDGGLIKVEICRKGKKPCHIGSIQQLVIDEGELITIGMDGYVRVWEMEAIDSADTTDDSDHFELEPMNELKVGNDVQLTCMVKASTEDDSTLEEGSSIWYAQDSNGGIWKLDLSFSHTTKPPEKLHSFTAGGVAGVAPSPSSHLMATTGDSRVQIHDYLTKELVCEYNAPTILSKGTSLIWPSQAVDPKGTTVLTGFSDGIMRILNLRHVEGTNELMLKQALKPHSSSITAMAFDNSGGLLATCSKDKTVFFFAVGDDVYEPIGFVTIPGEATGIEWSPPDFPDTTLLVSCSNGKVVEITAPNLNAVDTTHTYKLSDVPMRYYTFQSIKSLLRRNEEREKKEIARQKRRQARVKELKRRKEKGEEISDEDAAAFLDEDPEAENEEEEEPLFIPPEPNAVLQAFYLTPGRFAVSMGEYDAGYLYECVFAEEGKSEVDGEATEPVRAIPVKDSSDVPITTMRFSADRHKLFVGFQDGLLRVYPLEADPEMPFDLDMLATHWNLNMHDNQYGQVTDIKESHDGGYVFSSGGDGNVFGFHSLAHEEIIKSMEGKRAKLPTPKKRSAEERLIDDIDDPNAYSIEDAKLKAEQDKKTRDAEAKKLAERRRINKLRRTFLELLRKNAELPEHVQLKREEFELDPSIREKMVTQTHDRIERVRLEMQWDKEKLALQHRKIEDRFRSQLECDRVVVHAFSSTHTVATYRVAKLPDEYFALRSTVEQRVRAASLASEGFQGAMDGLSASLASDRGTDKDDDASFLGEAKMKAKTSLLHGRQAEKVAKAIKKADEAKKKHAERQREWENLYKSKPDKKYEDPLDVAAIKEAQANMGDFKLKTSTDYVVPEHLRMDTEKKRYQILILQGLIHRAKSEFNQKLLHLRDSKLDLITTMKTYSQDLKGIQTRMGKEERIRLPRIPNPHPEEQPHKKYEYTRETLARFEEDEKEREIAEAQKKRKGDGGLFGGFGDEAPPPEEAGAVRDLKRGGRKSASSYASSARSKGHKALARSDSSAPTALESQLSQIDQVRLRYQRDRLVRLVSEKMTSFDAELRLLRHDKLKIDVNLKMADLRQVTLLEELLLLKEYEKRETNLSGRVTGKRNELTEINGRVSEMQVRLESKKRDIDRLLDREKALYASFTTSLGDNNKFADFLNKVFKKKIKRAKKKIAKEGDEEDSDESSSDESDWSSEEDEDDSVEGGFDDSVCPPGCDQQLYDATLVLRERRLDVEEALVEEKKLAEALKKDVESLNKKSKVMESQLKNALDDLEAFQVEKQGKLNELDVVVLLRFHQVEHVYNATIPSDLSQCLVFANASLTALQRRIKELQQEKSEQRKLYKEARQQHVHLIKSGRLMHERIEQLEEKCEHAMLLKFGRIVDLDKLDSVTVNKNVEELKEQVRLNESRNATRLTKLQQHIENLKSRITELTRDNTRRLERLNVLMNDNNNLEMELDHRQKTMKLEENGKKTSEVREQHRLVQLVQLQAQEIQALKEEIGLLSRKGGHILPPAQPPLGQDPDVM